MSQPSFCTKKPDGRCSRNCGRQKLEKTKRKVKPWLPVLPVVWYFYGMLLNSIRLGIASTFPKPGQPEIQSIWTANPIKYFPVVFTPTGLGVTFFAFS